MSSDVASPSLLRKRGWVLFSVALLTRLLLLMAFNGQWAVLGPFATGTVAAGMSGEPDDVVLARNLVREHRYVIGYSVDANPTPELRKTAFWSPGTPVFYAAVQWLFPEKASLVIQLIQSLFLSVAFVLFAVFFESWFGPSTALVSYGFMVLSPFLGVAHLTFNNTAATVFLAAMFFFLFDRWLRNARPVDAVCVGSVFGVLLLFNASYVSFVIGFPLFLWVRGRSYWKQVALAAGVLTIVLLPWTVRNYAVFQRFIPLRSAYQSVFWVGNNPLSNGYCRLPDGQRILPDAGLERRMEGMNEVQRGDFLFRDAIGFIRENPGAFISLRVKTLFYFWTTYGYWNSPRLSMPRKALWGVTLLMIALSLCGGVLALIRNRSAQTVFIVSGMVLFGLSYALCHADVYERYRLSLDPLLLGFAAYALTVFSGEGRWKKLSDMIGRSAPAREDSSGR